MPRTTPSSRQHRRKRKPKRSPGAKPALSTVSAPPPGACYSVRQLAARWRIGTRKVKYFIKSCRLPAIDFGIGGRKTALRISPEAIATFEKLMALPTPALASGRRRKAADGISASVAALLDEGKA